MTKLLTAIALTIALPAVAQAGVAPAPASKADCHEKMKAAGMDCTKDMAMMDHGMPGMPGMAGAAMSAGHDKSPSGAKAPAADAHHNHQN